MNFIRLGNLVRCTCLTIVVAVTASCGDVLTSSDAPVMLVVNSLTSDGSSTLLSDVITDGVVVNDQGSVTLAIIMKDVTVSPTTNNGVTISRYRVEYRRADGHNTPGVDVPYAFDGVATFRILAGATGTLSFELVRHTAKLEAPLRQLRSNLAVISTITDVTFFGADQVGNDVSATGSMLINFADVADSSAEEQPPE